MPEVVKLETWADECNESTVQILEDFLQMAQDGELRSVVIAALEPSGCSRTAISKTDNVQAQIGAVTILQHRLLNDFLEPEVIEGEQ